MDSRKTYVRPAIESEVMLEQTSLACSMIMVPEGPSGYPICGPSSSHEDCVVPLIKGGSWDDTCTTPVLGSACPPIQYS